VIAGCTDSSANNYNPVANTDNGSCAYDAVPVPGCTDSSANNYNPSATTNNGSCTYDPPVVYGCTDSTARNYNSGANTDDGSCDYYPVIPTVTITADSNVVRAGSDFSMEWNPNGWLGTCTLLPAARFTGQDPDVAGNMSTAVTSKTVFTYRCAAPAGVYAATSVSTEVQTEVDVFPDSQEI
jgi:hypothetical protein